MAVTINGTTGIESVDGSSSTPSIRSTSDSNSGIFYAADTVSISTGGTERLEVDSSGNIDIPDNGKIRLGGQGDLEIYHQGFNSKIADVGTGALILSGSVVKIENAASSETQAVFTEDGAVELYYDNIKTFETISEGARVQGNEGASAVLELWADQGDDDGDKWRLVSDQSSNYFYIQNYASGGWENTLRAAGNGGVDLYHDNVNVFSTTGAGIACGEIRSQTTYNATTSNSANMYIHSNPWVIYRSTSSIKYKDNVTTLTDADADKILDCRPVTYTSKCDIDDSNEIHYGFIAEEVKDIDSRLVVFEGSEPENVKYDRFVPHLINLVKRLTNEVDTLKTEKTKLQTDLTALTARVAALEAA